MAVCFWCKLYTVVQIMLACEYHGINVCFVVFGCRMAV